MINHLIQFIWYIIYEHHKTRNYTSKLEFVVDTSGYSIPLNLYDLEKITDRY